MKKFLITVLIVSTVSFSFFTSFSFASEPLKYYLVTFKNNGCSLYLSNDVNNPKACSFEFNISGNFLTDYLSNGTFVTYLDSSKSVIYRTGSYIGFCVINGYLSYVESEYSYLYDHGEYLTEISVVEISEYDYNNGVSGSSGGAYSDKIKKFQLPVGYTATIDTHGFSGACPFKILALHDLGNAPLVPIKSITSGVWGGYSEDYPPDRLGDLLTLKGSLLTWSNMQFPYSYSGECDGDSYYNISYCIESGGKNHNEGYLTITVPDNVPVRISSMKVDEDGNISWTDTGNVISGKTNDIAGYHPIVDDNGDEVKLPQGGGNSDTFGYDGGIFGTVKRAINQFFDFVGDVVSSIGKVFTTSINASLTLVTKGSAFFKAMSGMYAWLPTELSALITSAFVVALAVGIVKVFL